MHCPNLVEDAVVDGKMSVGVLIMLEIAEIQDDFCARVDILTCIAMIKIGRAVLCCSQYSRSDHNTSSLCCQDE